MALGQGGFSTDRDWGWRWELAIGRALPSTGIDDADDGMKKIGWRREGLDGDPWKKTKKVLSMRRDGGSAPTPSSLQKISGIVLINKTKKIDLWGFSRVFVICFSSAADQEQEDV